MDRRIGREGLVYEASTRFEAKGLGGLWPGVRQPEPLKRAAAGSPMFRITSRATPCGGRCNDDSSSVWKRSPGCLESVFVCVSGLCPYNASHG